MRSVSWKARIGAVALMILLLAPTATMASDTSPATDPSLWATFVAWLTGGSDVSAGVTADDEGFNVWLMSRIGIPGG